MYVWIWSQPCFTLRYVILWDVQTCSQNNKVQTLQWNNLAVNFDSLHLPFYLCPCFWLIFFTYYKHSWDSIWQSKKSWHIESSDTEVFTTTTSLSPATNQAQLWWGHCYHEASPMSGLFHMIISTKGLYNPVCTCVHGIHFLLTWSHVVVQPWRISVSISFLARWSTPDPVSLSRIL